MARVAVPVTAQVVNTANNQAAGTAIDTANGHVLTVPNDGRVLLEVDNTGTAAAFTITVKAGDNPPAFQAGLGDLSFTVGTSGKHNAQVLLETARFMQDDGTINIDAAWATGGAGTIAAYSFPRTF